MKRCFSVLLSLLFAVGCHSFAGYEPASAPTTEVDGATSFDLGVGSEQGLVADGALRVDRSPDMATVDARADVVRDTGSPADDASVDAVRDTGSPADDASADAMLDTSEDGAQDATEDASDDSARDASEDASVDSAPPSPDATWDSLVDGVPTFSDAYVACRDAQTRLDFYLSIYQQCSLTADCAYSYTPPCGCVIFLNADPKSLSNLKTYERDVLNACYPSPIGCPMIYCGTAQAKCANQRCIASYTM